jgi:hypothetical protein
VIDDESLALFVKLLRALDSVAAILGQLFINLRPDAGSLVPKTLPIEPTEQHRHGARIMA